MGSAQKSTSWRRGFLLNVTTAKGYTVHVNFLLLRSLWLFFHGSNNDEYTQKTTNPHLHLRLTPSTPNPTPIALKLPHYVSSRECMKYLLLMTSREYITSANPQTEHCAMM